ncbi:hypothetical protein N7462_001214 [Penicillium macrosclerotiorum]|uniref:uncharacterized protein n=1 Tax=Penicillium macrosclerotiorum TaxID=303699 RepID=UPI002547BC3D|nr:uncharacterized protein N7462_001214 [Penicillium macrosclerotiorum]KAJ5691791.1 hypothetical protein N7462_001214 [Penicillium macrosclerotiorum]
MASFKLAPRQRIDLECGQPAVNQNPAIVESAARRVDPIKGREEADDGVQVEVIAKVGVFDASNR